MKSLVLVVLTLCLVGCGENKGRVSASAPGTKGIDGKDGSCSVKTIETGVLIECSDGSSAIVLNGAPGLKGERGLVGPSGSPGLAGIPGKDGKNGLDGKNGVDGKNGKDSTIAGPMGPPGICTKGDKGDSGKCDEHDHDYDDNGHDKYFICHLTESGKYITLKLSKEGYLAHGKNHKHDFDGMCDKADSCKFEH